MRHLPVSARSALLLSLAVLCLSAAGCCKPCLQPRLPLEPHPAMQQVESDDQGGLDEQNTKAMLINLESYKGALNSCNSTIEIYNLTVK